MDITIKTLLSFLFFLPLPVLAQANSINTDVDQKEIVVTASRFELPATEVASSVTVITAQEINESKQNRIEEVLRSVPGVDVVRSGGVGGNATIFIRGANSEHTLLLIDGIEVNNPITTARSFNFSDLALDNIEKIEILRGPQSALYGSNAIGGVVNIITKKGHGPLSATASFDGGSYRTFSEKGSVSGGDEVVNYSVAFQHQESTGFSSADKSYGNTEDDGFNVRGFSGRFGLNPTKQVEVNFYIRQSDSTSDLDNQGGYYGDDLNRRIKNSRLLTRLEAKTSLFDNKLKQTYGVSWAKQQFSDNNDPDTINSDFLRSLYHGNLFKLDFQNNLELSKWLIASFGAETFQERGESDYDSITQFGPFAQRFDLRKSRSSGYYAELQGEFENWFPVIGLRANSHTGEEDRITWRVGQSYLVKSTGSKLHATYGTGYKAPSLYELYSSYGDINLESEKSSGVDCGIEQAIIEDELKVGIVYFYNDFSHLITFDPNTFKFDNIASARSQGLEANMTITPAKDLDLIGSYTYTATHDPSTGKELLRRPRHKLALDTRYQFNDKLSGLLSFQYVGERSDNDYSTYPATRKKLGGYPLVNLVLSYQILPKNIELYSRIDNLLDRDYEEILGFGSQGFTAIAGIKVML